MAGNRNCDQGFLGGFMISRSFLDALYGSTSDVLFFDLKPSTFCGLPSLWISEEEILALAAPLQFALVDNATSIGSRPSVVRVLVELDIIKKYPDKVWLGPEKLGYIQLVNMEDFLPFVVTVNVLGILGNVVVADLEVEVAGAVVGTVEEDILLSISIIPMADSCANNESVLVVMMRRPSAQPLEANGLLATLVARSIVLIDGLWLGCGFGKGTVASGYTASVAASPPLPAQSSATPSHGEKAKEELTLSLLQLQLLPMLFPARSCKTLASIFVGFSFPKVRSSFFSPLLHHSHKPFSKLLTEKPQFDSLIFGILKYNPHAFTSGFRAPARLKHLISDRHLFLCTIHSIGNQPRVALRFFRWAERQPGFHRSEIPFCVVLEILADAGLMKAAYSVADRALTFGLHGIVDLLIGKYVNSDVTIKLLNLLLWMYTKCSMVERAMSTFRKMMDNGFLPEIKNCNRILRVLRDGNMWSDVRAVYQEMVKAGVQPTIVTYNTILDCYCKEGQAEEAYMLLLDMEFNNFAGCLPNDVTYNVVINGLSKKGELEKAEKLLAKMHSSGNASAYTYNPLINALFSKGFADRALLFENDMLGRGVAPSVTTYNTIIYWLCKMGKVEEARRKFTEMESNGLVLDVVSYNSLMYGYCRLGNVMEALSLFEDLRRARIVPTVRTFNIIIDGHCRLGALEKARKLKEYMIEFGCHPDVYTYTILVNGSCKTGDLAMAKAYFDEMLHKGLQPDCFAYDTRIACELKHGDISGAFQLREEMVARGVSPDIITYNILLDGIFRTRDWDEAYWLWRKMINDGLVPDCVTYTCIIHALCGKGHLDKAKKVFDRMLCNNVSPSVVTYTVLIHAYASKGSFGIAYEFFVQMLQENVQPNEITYNALINGLCRTLNVRLAYRCFYEMQERGLSPNKYTYTLLINLSCDLGYWDEVKRLYGEMLEKGILPDSCTYSVLFKHVGDELKDHTVYYLDNYVLAG
ncbi:hypothetical protein M5K25_021440 [Dendrobium thyrsiflorum]|uniref:Pentatricopeptide repeat-containing protein n=1 Tax=Dendrobium thyrsiflorum TaxID=117978 RepID=A0ABD0UCD9_DENTH